MYSQELEAVIQILKQNPSMDLEVIDIQQGRARLETMSNIVQVPPDVICRSVDVENIPAEEIIAPGATEKKVMLYLHGGAYLFGSIKSHREFASRLSRACKLKVLLIGYRLAPESPFPAALEDAKAAYRWLLKKYDPKTIVIAGDSSGGGLALAAVAALRDEGEALPAAIVCMSPWTNLAATKQELEERAKREIINLTAALVNESKLYLNGADPYDPYVSPVYADFNGFPPIMIQVAGNETLFLDSTIVTEKARNAGIEVNLEVWEDIFHVWQPFAVILPEGQQAIEHIGEYVIKTLT